VMLRSIIAACHSSAPRQKTPSNTCPRLTSLHFPIGLPFGTCCRQDISGGRPCPPGAPTFWPKSGSEGCTSSWRDQWQPASKSRRVIRHDEGVPVKKTAQLYRTCVAREFRFNSFRRPLGRIHWLRLCSRRNSGGRLHEHVICSLAIQTPIVHPAFAYTSHLNWKISQSHRIHQLKHINLPTISERDPHIASPGTGRSPASRNVSISDHIPLSIPIEPVAACFAVRS
jgi:hypothetical protein